MTKLRKNGTNTGSDCSTGSCNEEVGNSSNNNNNNNNNNNSNNMSKMSLIVRNTN